jgi:hypothetical protein
MTLVTGSLVTDDELAALAVASDPDPVLDEDAVSFWELTGAGPDQRLPEWYMPSPLPGAPRLYGWRRHVVLLVIASFRAINAYGLCNTYGWVSYG